MELLEENKSEFILINLNTVTIILNIYRLH